ncbi:MAG: hypothetical protein OFPI_03400 [Osedax symbiont Rs2]|nr:MAG: hypothetical protein OFPII_15420 [Osedax symbiont Rs1]EPJ55487.1 MAG: hypothetical protein OFPI_03400 [Osedax symbiont Rs2]
MLKLICVKRRALIFLLFFVVSTATSAGTLNIFATNYPPFNIKSAPSQPGFDVEVSIAAFAAVGIDIEVKFQPWARIMRDVKSGVATAAVTCSKVKERLSFADLSEQISSTRMAVITHRNYSGAPLSVVDDLRNKKVIAVNGFATQKELVKNGIKHSSVNSIEDALAVLLRRNQDVFYIGWESAAYVAQQMGILDKLNFAGVASVDDHPFYLCFSKKWPASKKLLKTFNKGLKIIQENGTFQNIHARYGL